MKILYISNEFQNVKSDGGTLINERNFKILKEIGKVDLYLIKKKNRLSKIINFLFSKNITDLTEKDLKNIIKKIKKNEYEYIFVSSSLLGNIFERLEKQFPKLKKILFFHNVEIIFKKEMLALSSKNKLIKKICYKSIVKQEKKSVENADYLITLNTRDAREVEKIYNRKVDLILPTTLEDRYIEKERRNFSKKKQVLFVGSKFYANVEGIEWFIEKILKHLNDNIELVVVGKGMEYLNEKYSNLENLKVYGYVEDLGEKYIEADAVVLPILSGSGMKTKTAEAMMYGKFLFATTEALEGYEEYINEKFVRKCDSVEKFIHEINLYFKEENNNFNLESRKSFLENLTLDTSVEKLRKIIKE